MLTCFAKVIDELLCIERAESLCGYAVSNALIRKEAEKRKKKKWAFVQRKEPAVEFLEL